MVGTVPTPIVTGAVFALEEDLLDDEDDDDDELREDLEGLFERWCELLEDEDEELDLW